MLMFAVKGLFPLTDSDPTANSTIVPTYKTLLGSAVGVGGVLGSKVNVPVSSVPGGTPVPNSSLPAPQTKQCSPMTPSNAKDTWASGSSWNGAHSSPPEASNPTTASPGGHARPTNAAAPGGPGGPGAPSAPSAPGSPVAPTVISKLTKVPPSSLSSSLSSSLDDPLDSVSR